MGANLLVGIRSGRIVVRVSSLQYSTDCQIWLSVCLLTLRFIQPQS